MIRWTEDATPGHPYWWDAAPPDPSSDELPGRVDVLVIGAGFTGLSAAIAAHDAGASVAVVDAGIPAAAASSLNGGMFGAHPRLPWEQLAKAYGEEVADGIFAEARPALEFAKDLIAREGIDCDLTQTGRIQLAWTESHFANQKRLASHVAEKSGVAVEVVEREGLKDEIATDRYYGGLLFPEHCAVHPGKYAQGLLRAVRARGVHVVAHAEVTRLERVEGFLALTPKGEVRARKVILATNGYTTPAFRALQARVFPLPSFLIATEPLPSNLLGHLAPGRRMMVETRARHSYFRLSPDGTRILYGGRSSMRPVDLKVAAAR
ncbi:MAG: FAD-dependent oxidoreductase, partial [Pseudomonadota bacterium]